METISWRRLAAALTAVAALGAGPARAFDLVDTAGTPQRLADFKGRWVVLNFWATWCVPCIQEIPEIASFRREHPEVAVIGVAIDVDAEAKVRAFAKKVGHDYPLVLSNDAVEKQLGAPKALPTTRIFDPSGRMVYDKPSRVDRRMIETLTRVPSKA